MKKKNIIIITGVFIPEPVVSAKILSDLALDLSNNYSVTVLRPKPTRPLGFVFPFIDSNYLPYKVVVLDSYTYPKSKLVGRFRESYSMGLSSVKYINKNHKNIDLIYNAPWSLFGRFMVAKAAKKYKIPYITPVQDIYPESILSKFPKWLLLQSIIKKILMPFDRVTLANAEKIHTISEKMKNYLSETRGIDLNQFIVISNWQDEKQFINYRNQNSIEKENINSLFTFMYLGNVGPLAGIELLIDAFVKANIINSRLVIAGSGSTKEKLIKHAKLYQQSKIEFWDVPSGKVPEMQAKADVMLLPVKKYFSATSVPSKLPAYMFSAKPVLAAVDSNGDTALSIVNSECGWLSESENVEMLAELMLQAYSTDKNQLKKMGGKGFQYAMKYFSRKNNLPKLCKACDKVIKEKQT